MWIEKIRRSVLAVETESGVRYVQMSVLQRVRLAWTFRNFNVLPEEVLTRQERRLLERLCRHGKYLANWNGHGDLSEHCVGIIERSRRKPPVAVAEPAERARPQAAHTILPRTG